MTTGVSQFVSFATLTLPYICICVSLAASLYVFLAVPAHVGRRMRDLQSNHESAECRLADLSAQIKEMQTEMRDLREQLQVLGPAAGPRAAVNFSTRSQALRLHRKGEPADRIAAALGVGQGEVALMIKAYDMTQAGARTGSRLENPLEGSSGTPDMERRRPARLQLAPDPNV